MRRRGFIGLAVAAAFGARLATERVFGQAGVAGTFRGVLGGAKQVVAVVNPAWVDAPYEVVCHFHKDVFIMMTPKHALTGGFVRKDDPDTLFAQDPLACRYATVEDAAAGNDPIPPYILKEVE